jgi:Fe2+ transport system protein B
LPCAYTFVVQAKESGHWKWAAFAGIFQLTIAVTFTLAVHIVGRVFVTLMGL